MIEHFDRYPNYICGDCVSKLVDVNDVPIRAQNETLLGTGLAAWLLDGETGNSDKLDPIASMTGQAYCYGVMCKAEEAYFGGVIVQSQLA